LRNVENLCKILLTANPSRVILSVGEAVQANSDPLLTTEDLAEYVHVPVATVYQWNYRKTGPAAIRVGRHLRFRKSTVDAWLAANTADTGAGAA